MLRKDLLWGSLSAAIVAALTLTSDARACGGGMFYDVNDQSTVSVRGHQVVVSISKTRTVLWDRISYAGAPADFAWVMPVAPGAKLELASAAWVEAIVGGTTPIVSSGEALCDEGGGDDSGSSGCCGAALRDGGGYNGGTTRDRGDVTVVHAADIGPYETVTIKSDVPGAIGQWLGDNGYGIPASVQPILDDYAAEGLEFIAAKLKPGAGVQEMKPLRVVMEGMLTTFPMRMLSAGAKDSVPITLAVISEGRYEAQGFTNVVMDAEKLTWDFDARSSNYDAVRAALLAGNGGETWMTGFAANEGLLGPLTTDDTDAFSLGEGDAATTLAGLYFARARSIGETTVVCSTDAVAASASLAGEVVELCADTTMPCSTLLPGQIDAGTLGCGPLDDLSRAMVGLHPRDVWVTRLEADLPVAALAEDLTLTPAATQEYLSRIVVAGGQTGDPCNAEYVAALEVSPLRRSATPLGALALGLGLAIARRRRPRRDR